MTRCGREKQNTRGRATFAVKERYSGVCRNAALQKLNFRFTL